MSEPSYRPRDSPDRRVWRPKAAHDVRVLFTDSLIQHRLFETLQLAPSGSWMLNFLSDKLQPELVIVHQA